MLFVYQMEKQYMIATPHTLLEISKHLVLVLWAGKMCSEFCVLTGYLSE